MSDFILELAKEIVTSKINQVRKYSQRKPRYQKTKKEELCMMPEMKCDYYCKYSRACK